MDQILSDVTIFLLVVIVIFLISIVAILLRQKSDPHTSGKSYRNWEQ